MSNTLAQHIATTSPNHVQLDGDKLAARDDAYDTARELVAEFSDDAVRDVLDSYTSARAMVDRDAIEWWAIHGSILAARDELRARAQQLLDTAAESETTDPVQLFPVRSACCGQTVSRPAPGQGTWTCDNCHRPTT